MKILSIGDIFGKTGKKILEDFLSKIVNYYSIDFVIANVENSADRGKSVTKKDFYLMKSLGINVMTTGNHTFSLEETRSYISEFPELLRPLNSNPYHPGNGSFLTIFKDKKIRVTNLIGNSFMPFGSENPYFALEKVVSKNDCDIHIVDFHAESTAEKSVLAWYFDGKISVIYGTHTHVQTADERILSKGTGFVTDIGMTGPSQGIIGARPESIIKRTKLGYPSGMEAHEDDGQFNAIIIEINDKDNKVLSIKRLNFSRKYLTENIR